MEIFQENLTINDRVIDGQRESKSHENGQEKSSISRRVRREVMRRVSKETRQKIKDIFANGSLKNTYIDSNGDLCFIMLKDNNLPGVSFYILFKNYGVGKKYDPSPQMQRRDKQHSLSDRKQILLSYLSKEHLGQLLVVKKPYVDADINVSNKSYYIIDGRQRSSIIIEFLNDNLKLTGDDAKNFWKWYLNDEFLYSDNLTEDDKIKANKIIKSLESAKIPTVKFSSLPNEIKNHIMEDFSVYLTESEPLVMKLTNDQIVEVDKSEWDINEERDAISRKFTDINRYVKKIDNKDIIRTSSVDVVRRVWDFLEDKPTIAREMGYTLQDVHENGFLRFDDTNEVRKLQILITRALCIYENYLQWGDSENMLQKKVTNGDNLNFSTKTRSLWTHWKKLIGERIFSESYFDGEEKKFKLHSEFVGSRSDIMKIEFFLTTLYLIEYMFKDNYGARFGYFQHGLPTRKFFRLLEKIMTYLTVGKLANINHEEWFDEDKPLVKYNLVSEFDSQEVYNGIKISELLRKVKDFNQHQKGLSRDSENTIRTLIKYSETKIS